MYICIYYFTFVGSYTYAYTCTCTCNCMYIYVYIVIYIHIYNLYMYIYEDKCKSSDIHMYMHMYISRASEYILAQFASLQGPMVLANCFLLFCLFQHDLVFFFLLASSKHPLALSPTWPIARICVHMDCFVFSMVYLNFLEIFHVLRRFDGRSAMAFCSQF